MELFCIKIWSAHLRHDELTARIFIRTIITVFFTVTEEPTLNAVSITTSKVTVLTEGFIGDQQRLHFALLILELAVLNRILPIASLFFNVCTGKSFLINWNYKMKHHLPKKRPAGQRIACKPFGMRQKLINVEVDDFKGFLPRLYIEWHHDTSRHHSLPNGTIRQLPYLCITPARTLPSSSCRHSVASHELHLLEVERGDFFYYFCEKVTWKLGWVDINLKHSLFLFSALLLLSLNCATNTQCCFHSKSLPSTQ